MAPANRQLRSASIPAAVAILLTLALVVYSEQGFEAAVGGLNLFLNIVFPSLLPFFVMSEVMLGLGVVHFMGAIFEPLMRPLFNVPGVGAFVLSMGLAAGYPMDAVITGKFRRSGLCTKVEGERLLAFTNTADPLFIFGAVAVGMFHSPKLGAVLAGAHYLAALAVGLIFRFYGRRNEGDKVRNGESERRGFIIIRAYRELHRARAEDGRPLGQLLGDAVVDSVRTLLMICGFIMFFSVALKVLEQTGIASYLSLPIAALASALGFDESLVPAMFAGVLEIDIGTLQASLAPAPVVQQAVVAGVIIAWSGLSVHGQVASVLAGTDIGMKPYIVARALHAALAGVFTLLLIDPASLAASPAPSAPTLAGSDWVNSIAHGVWPVPQAETTLYLVLTALALGWRLARGGLTTGR